MPIAVERQILDELRFVKSKVLDLDKAFHRLRESFEDAHLSEEERRLVARALKEEQEGKTIPLATVKKRLGL